MHSAADLACVQRAVNPAVMRPVLVPVGKGRKTGAGLSACTLFIQISAAPWGMFAETGGGGHLLPSLAAARSSWGYNFTLGIVAQRQTRSACMVRVPKSARISHTKADQQRHAVPRVGQPRAVQFFTRKAVA